MSLPSRQVYKEVRGLTRGLDVLRALNAMYGGEGAIGDIAARCQLHRTTVKRVLETLRSQGLVGPGAREGHYRLTFEVRRLSEGYVEEDWVKNVAQGLMRQYVQRLMWPTDLATLDHSAMVVRESTHRWSLLSQHSAMVGERVPLLTSAIGRAYFAACPAAERRALCNAIVGEAGSTAGLAQDAEYLQQIVKTTRRRGYAMNTGGEWSRQPHVAAIALPIWADTRLIASINLIYPIDAISPSDMRLRYLPVLRELAGAIGHRSLAWLRA